MSRDDAVIWTLAAHFAVLSLIAIGGINVVLPEMHRLSVDVYGWMTTRDFADLYAIAQVAPGPNIIVVSLIGSQVAGLPGATVATLAIVGPSSILTYVTSGLWDRYKATRWRIAAQNGLVPVALGLVAASAYIIARTADRSLAAGAITLVTAGILYFAKLHPLILLAAGAAFGLTGFV